MTCMSMRACLISLYTEHSTLPAHPTLAAPNYSDIRHFAESGHMYRAQGETGDRAEGGHRFTEIPRTDEDRDSEKDSGLALNLSTDRDGSRDTESGRSSNSGSPPVSSSNIQDGSSSGDESGYPRSPNSSGSQQGEVQGEAQGHLPHKLRFKSAMSEKEAVTSLLSLHQMAMIKREPADHINNWMETAGSGLSHAGLLAGLGGLLPPGHFTRLLDRPEEREEVEEEPSRKRQKVNNPAGPFPHKLSDEVARLTSEVATLKNILVNRMKDEEEEDRPASQASGTLIQA